MGAESRSRWSRRDLLLATGVALSTALSGCSTTRNEPMTSQNPPAIDWSDFQDVDGLNGGAVKGIDREHGKLLYVVVAGAGVQLEVAGLPEDA